MTKMLYSIRRCCSSIAGDEHSALQKANGCPPSAPRRSYTLIWAWICVLVIFWYVSSSCPRSAASSIPKSRWRLPKYHNTVHKPQLCTSAFLPVTCSRQIPLSMNNPSTEDCTGLSRQNGLRTLPDATSHCKEMNKSWLTYDPILLA